MTAKEYYAQGPDQSHSKTENSTNPTGTPYKEEEYEAFIKLLESGVPIYAWKDAAASFGISRDTLWEWRKTPRAIAAIRKSIQEAIQGMKAVGNKDWKMWDRYAKLHGLDVADKHEITADPSIINLDNLTQDKLDQLKSLINEAGTTAGDLSQ